MSIFGKRNNYFTELYNDFYPVVYSSVFSKIGNTEVTKDICQEVFIRFFEKFDEIENHRKWILGCLRLVVLEYYRNKRDKTENIENYFQDITMSFINGFKDTRYIIEEALNDINNFKTEKDRILFELIAIHDFTYESAGKQLGLTIHQARYKYSVILKKLIEYFKNHGINNLEDLL